MCVFLGFRPSRVPKIAKNHVFYYGFRETPRRDLQGHPWGNKGGLQPPESTPDDTRNAKNMHFTVCFARFQNVCENVAKLQKTRVVKTYGFFQLKRLPWSSPGPPRRRKCAFYYVFLMISEVGPKRPKRPSRGTPDAGQEPQGATREHTRKALAAKMCILYCKTTSFHKNGDLIFRKS